MKKVSEELRYDGATIEQVHEMLRQRYETFRPRRSAPTSRSGEC